MLALLPLLDAAALFRFPTPNVGADELPLDTATIQATEWLFFGLSIASLRGQVEGQRGAFIDFPTLVPCGRIQLRAPSMNDRRIPCTVAAGYIWCPVWLVRLERPVRMAGRYNQRLQDLTDLYAGDANCPAPLGRTTLLTPWWEQPATREFAAVVKDSTGISRRVSHLARYRSPVVFESLIKPRYRSPPG